MVRTTLFSSAAWRSLQLSFAFVLMAFILISGCTPETVAVPVFPTGGQGPQGLPGADAVGVDAGSMQPGEPDAGRPYPCPQITLPASFGGVANASLDLDMAQRWLDFRAAREEERLREAASPEAVAHRYRIEQEWIDEGCLTRAEAIDVGRGIFMRRFTLAEGFGNDLASIDDPMAGDKPRPNMRRFQKTNSEGRTFGGPDATTCLDCHWKGGFAGAGDRADNTFFGGDGNDIYTHEARNPPALWGVGWVQLVAQEINHELAALVEQGRADAVAAQETITVPLLAKGIGYGTIDVHVDEGGETQVDTSGVRGIDSDLIVKPFGWMGAFATLREFIVQSAHVHMNLQSEELVEAGSEAFSYLYLGAGPSSDPDNDGVERELTEGQVTALEMFLATLDVPQVMVPVEEDYAVRWVEGAEIFDAIDCDRCHIPSLPLTNTVYRSETGLSKTQWSMDLRQEAATPIPGEAADGTFHVPVFSDFKRHDMGGYLSGVAGEHGIARGQYMTRRLWGLYNTGPYLHDGSASLFDEAIGMHGGVGSEARGEALNFMELDEYDKASLRIYLLSLARAPSIRVR